MLTPRRAALIVVAALGVTAAACQPLAPPPPSQPTIVVYGDSFVQQSSTLLTFGLARPGWTVQVQAYPGTALCDWLPRMRTTPATIVVLAFSGLQETPCAQGRGDQLHVYTTDGDTAARVWTRAGTKVLWVGLPGTVGTVGANPIIQLSQNVAAAHHQGFVNAAAGLQARDGSWPVRLPCLPSEHRAQGCAADGLIQVRTSATNGHLCVVNEDPCTVYSSGEARWVGAIATAVKAL